MRPSTASALAALCLALAGCAAPFGPAATTSRECWPSFPYQDGWLGGDAAYAVRLSESETLWLFGDSFVGEPGQRDRRGATFIHNSIAKSRCEPGGRFQIRYSWGRDAEGGARAFLDPGQPGAWWWLFDGFVHDDRLYVGLLAVESAPPHGPLAMPFRFGGMELARIENYRDDVDEWRVEVIGLSQLRTALPGSAMVVHDAYVYLFTFVAQADGHYPRILTRLPLSALDGRTRDLGPALEYLAHDGAWKPGLDPQEARIVMDDSATEMSVRYAPELGKWLALYSYPEVGAGFPKARPSDAVWVRSAESVEGPWSPRRLLFRIPELDPSYVGGFDPNTACYAAKEQPQFSKGSRITFTYVCNLFTGAGQDPNAILGRLLDEMGLYRPMPVSVVLPEL